jgi:radical SAM superfamily enzyme YgiQ (UPF0313 family)
MTAAAKICQALKERTKAPVAIGGLHPSALPRQTLEQETVDFVIEGEGLYTLKLLLELLKSRDNAFEKIPGLWWRHESDIRNTPRPPLISNLDEMLPIAAWDLLPMEMYRAHNWHCFDFIHNRKPYGAIYTSLGCPYSCVFCCINKLFGKPGIRYRSPEQVVKEISLLNETYGIRHLKLVDELFILNEQHYMTIVDLLLKKQHDLNIWAYARVDSIKSKNLDNMKKVGINWLALGIESAHAGIRANVEKRMPPMTAGEIKEKVRQIQEAGIRVIGNYIFGLPGDTLETMQQTLETAVDINCEFANFYCAMAYPGSQLYEIAIKNKWKLPDNWHGFSQHAYETLPLPTKYLSAAQVLGFRDKAFHYYFENPLYLNMIEKKFGVKVKIHIMEMSKKKLKRKLLGD